MKPEESEASVERIESPPARGAWIETLCTTALVCAARVAPRAGGVD